MVGWTVGVFVDEGKIVGCSAGAFVGVVVGGTVGCISGDSTGAAVGETAGGVGIEGMHDAGKQQVAWEPMGWPSGKPSESLPERMEVLSVPGFPA